MSWTESWAERNQKNPNVADSTLDHDAKDNDNQIAGVAIRSRRTNQ